MADIHIPAEVVETGAKKAYEAETGHKWKYLKPSEQAPWLSRSQIIITAALSAWVETGMARKGTDCAGCWQDGNKAWIHQDAHDTNYPVLIIRTEAT